MLKREKLSLIEAHYSVGQWLLDYTGFPVDVLHSPNYNWWQQFRARLLKQHAKFNRQGAEWLQFFMRLSM